MEIEYAEKAMSFGEYTQLIDQLLTEGKTTGPVQNEAMFNYGKLNRQRMKRLEKTVAVDPEVAASIRALDVDWTWLVLTEGWCGDAAQNIPVIEKIAALNEGIKTRYLLRDENAELMDKYLTNGARSIPKLIALDRRTGEVLGTWGARPKSAQEHFFEMKRQGFEKPAIMESLQRWYLEDAGMSLQKEFEALTADWASRRRMSAAG
jgi:hypothetical protein